jgi:hypothetical protein
MESRRLRSNDQNDVKTEDQIRYTEFVIGSELFATLFANLKRRSMTLSDPYIGADTAQTVSQGKYRLVKLERDGSNEYGFNCICINNSLLFVSHVQASSIARLVLQPSERVSARSAA